MSNIKDALLQALLNAAASFALVAKTIDSLPGTFPDDAPARDYMFREWPTLGDLRRLRMAVEALAVETPRIDESDPRRVRLTVTLDRPETMSASDLRMHVENLLNPALTGDALLNRVRVALVREPRKAKVPEHLRRIK